MDPFDFLNEMGKRMEQIEMQLELLYAVVERTGNYREGFYAMRLVNDLSKQVAKMDSPDEAIRQLDNVLATLATQTDRVDA